MASRAERVIHLSDNYRCPYLFADGAVRGNYSAIQKYQMAIITEKELGDAQRAHWLKAVAAPLAGLRFCPTGGIGADTASSYLALPNVACIGCSWVAPRDAVAAGDWQKVERLAAAAANLKRR